MYDDNLSRRMAFLPIEARGHVRVSENRIPSKTDLRCSASAVAAYKYQQDPDKYAEFC